MARAVLDDGPCWGERPAVRLVRALRVGYIKHVPEGRA